MTPRTFFAALVAAALAQAAHAHHYTLGALEIGHPYAFATVAGVVTGAGYFEVTNTGSEPDRLVEVRADFPDVQLHVTEVDDAGVARMMEVEGVEIPPGATVTLAPRGLHIMFIGLEEPLAEGARIPATLVFEKSGEIAVEFAVEPRGAAAGEDDHSGHGAGH
jgi:copper(I)-binding protein